MQVSFQEIINRCLSFERKDLPEGVSPESVAWETRDGDGYTTGVFYPVLENKPKRPSYSIFGNTGNTNTEKVPKKKSSKLFKEVSNTSPIETDGDDVRISKEEYQILLKYKERALIEGTFKTVTGYLNSVILELDGLNTEEESVNNVKVLIQNALTVIEEY